MPAVLVAIIEVLTGLSILLDSWRQVCGQKKMVPIRAPTTTVVVESTSIGMK